MLEGQQQKRIDGKLAYTLSFGVGDWGCNHVTPCRNVTCNVGMQREGNYHLLLEEDEAQVTEWVRKENVELRASRASKDLVITAKPSGQKAKKRARKRT